MRRLYRSIAGVAVVIGGWMLLSACQAQPVSTPLPPTRAAASPTALPQSSASDQRGFVVYDQAQSRFVGYDFGGHPLNLEIAASNIAFGFDVVQAVGDAVYYYTNDKSIVRADPQGTRTLDLATTGNLSAFKVSPDEKQIAWTVDLWDQTPPYSELWIANLDGTDARVIAKSATDKSFELLVPKPFGWSDDGRLLIAEIPTGIGGYILYRAWNSLLVFDPATGQTTPLYKPEEPYEVCLSGVAPDLSRVAFGCGQSGAGEVSILTVSDQQRATVPKLPEQGQAGSPRFSSSGAWLAYAIARGDPENESSQVVVVPVDLSAQPMIVASQENGFGEVIDWIDDDTLLIFLMREGSGAVWRVNRDGSDLAQLATGSYVIGMVTMPSEQEQ